MELAFGEAHVRELPGKVARALEEDYDMSAGVNPNSRRPFPIKANIDLMVHRAKRLTDFNQRAALYQRCIDYNPTDGRAWLGLARIYAKKGQLDKAEKAYKDGLYYSPKNPFLLQSWAVQLEKQGKLAEATKMLTKSIKANTRHAASWVALAKIHQRTGRLEEARFCYSSACEGDDESYVALQAWGTLESAAGNVALARDLFARSVRASGSRSAHALQAWATLERRQGNLEEAQRLLDRALRSNPQNSKVRTSYAEIHEMRGDFALARAAYEEGAQEASKAGDAGFFQSWALFEFRQEEARLLRARSQQQQGGEEKGEGEGVAPPANVSIPTAWPGLSDAAASSIRGLFKRAVTLNRFHSASWVAWAKFEQQSGNVAAARKLLVTGISNFPHSRNAAWFHCSLGRLSCIEGDLNTARACYDRALKSSPPQLSLSIFLESAKMEDQLGSAVAARRLLEAAAKRFPWEDRAWDALVDFERRHATDPALQTETQGKWQGQGLGQGQGEGTGQGEGQGKMQGQKAAEDAVMALQRRRETEQSAALEARQSRSRKLDSFRQLSLSDLELPDETTSESQGQGQDGGKRWRQGGGEQRRFDWQQEDEDEDEEFAGWAGLDRLFGGAP